MRLKPHLLFCLLCSAALSHAALDVASLPPAAQTKVDFVKQIQPLFQKSCSACHGENKQKGGYRLDHRAAAFKGGDSGAAFIPGKSAQSPLIHMVAGLIEDQIMPAKGKPLSPEQIGLLRAWIDQGAPWPASADTIKESDPLDFWSLRPLRAPTVPAVGAPQHVRNPIDAFIFRKLKAEGLTPAPEADRRTLIRRLYFDLIGLPPTPEEVREFVSNRNPRVYELLVEKLLGSSHYGERWARHWLDIVHYGDTHGYDKDQTRPNAWPYRDYVIRAFNEDRPYGQFVREQLAGDILYPNTVDGITATGFIAAGPWDLIGHAEVPESKIDGKVARHLDRDDMVSSTMNTFQSMTVQCARCHNHKFDPVTMDDYYSLHAVFAALDRADRAYDPDPEVARLRADLSDRKSRLGQEKKALEERVTRLGGPKLKSLNTRIADLSKPKKGNDAAFGYHSQIMARQNATKWVQVDLGAAVKVARLAYVGCRDSFNNIGDGFGFPLRFKIEVSNDPDFKKGVRRVVDQTDVDFPNPGVTPQFVPVENINARYVRVTATKLAPRKNDYIFALAELMVLDANNRNLARDATVTALDSIEAPVRWQRRNLVDGYYVGVSNNADHLAELAQLTEERSALLKRALGGALIQEQERLEKSLADITARVNQLPSMAKVYAGTIHHGSGAFRGTGGMPPRKIHVLRRGDVRSPVREAHAGTLPIFQTVAHRFKKEAPEGDRRVALANWIAHKDNPLTWRSIVNRIWHYHFGRGIVDTPNDFGRMGSRPTHPELLDWLAAQFRDGNQSIKQLHRLIVTSATYRQSSANHAVNASRDASNQYLWRMNRRRLSAEEIRDTTLSLAGKLDRKMYGPGFQDFVIEKPQHSPHYQYHLHDPNDPKSHRRSIYRFLVRSQQNPFMTTLDCADPSQMVARRNETLTALQALALLNNRLMLSMAGQFAAKLKGLSPDPATQIRHGFEEAVSRQPTTEELTALVSFTKEHGLANTCRLILNLNEFVFVD